VLGCVVAILLTLRMDSREDPGASRALWLVVMWVFIAGSRSPSTWLGVRPGFGDAQSVSDGSPVDALVYFSLIIAMALALARRSIAWSELVAVNKLALAYFAYCMVSMLWADEAFVTLKRLIKDLGNPLAALLILTDRDSVRAFGWVWRRFAFLVVPLSIVFIRYVPELGRDFSVSGVLMNTGVATQKNGLGQSCLLAGVYFLWLLMLDSDRMRGWSGSMRAVVWIVAAMTVYTLMLSDSKTSAVCLGLALGTFFLAGRGYVRSRPTRLIASVCTIAALAWLVEEAFDVSDEFYALLGRNPSLTSRTDIWALLSNFEADPLIGTGYMSFWSGERMTQIWNLLGVNLNQAHNGYYEQYLNLGTVGVAFIVLLMIKAIWLAKSELQSEPRFGSLRLCLVVISAVYNYTEASFYGINNVWLILVLAFLQVPASCRPAGERHPVEAPIIGEHFGRVRRGEST
jgi:O-antigen ligase